MSKDQLQRAEARTPPSGRPSVVHLADHLEGQGRTMRASELNWIGCQVMDLQGALLAGDVRQIDYDLQSWLYVPDEQRVIFPWRGTQQLPAAQEGTKQLPAAQDRPPQHAVEVLAERIYRQWFDLLDSLQLGFSKPAKRVYPTQGQQPLQADLQRYLHDVIAAEPAVTRIHLMGSALRADMGSYDVPFVHRRLVKLGSDIDLLIEIDPAREDRLPAEWTRYLAKAPIPGCAVYHLGELPLPEGPGNWQAVFPAIAFHQHLIVAQVFLPSRCDPGQRDAFLKTYQAKLVYDRNATTSEETVLAELLTEQYALPDIQVAPMNEPTGNRVYAVRAGAQQLVLKMSLDAGTYSRRRLTEHARYEAALIEALRARGVRTPAVVAARTGLTANIQGQEAILFERFDGSVCETLEYPIEAAAAALAQIHLVQQESPLALPQTFPYETLVEIWLPYFERSRASADLPAELVAACALLDPIAREYADPATRRALITAGPRVHCHGDVKPRNVVVHADGGVSLFDFDNALFAPRLADVVEGGITFSLAEQHIDHADFWRCHAFLAAYRRHGALTAEEEARLPAWLRFGCLLQFTRELTTWVTNHDDIRRRRALAIAAFVAEQNDPSATRHAAWCQAREPATA